MSITCKANVDFVEPPIVEVVCGVQFDAIGLASGHYGAYWGRIAEDFPITHDQPPLPSVLEKPVGTETLFDMPFGPDAELPPLRRAFFESRDRSLLIQLQPSRFLFNWRKTPKATSYPRFSKAYATFEANWKKFDAFVKDVGMSALAINQYELTYVNHIPVTSGSVFDAAKRVLPSLLDGIAAEVGGCQVESVATRLRCSLPDGRGRLHVSVGYVKNLASAQDLIVFELTTRGPAVSSGRDMDAWFSVAHDAVIEVFMQLTSKESKTSWGHQGMGHVPSAR